MTNIPSLFKYSLRSLLVCCYKLSAFSGSFSHSSLQNFSDSIRLDVECWCTFIDVQSGIHRVVLEPLLCYFGHVFRVGVLLADQPLPESEPEPPPSLHSYLCARSSLGWFHSQPFS